jgi:hypothetical protein
MDGSTRRAARLGTRLSAVLQGREPLEVEILDLSLTGCLARCRVLLDRGRVMDLALSIPDHAVLTKVRVAEASRDGEAGEGDEAFFLTGLEFLALPPGGEQALRQFLDAERRRRQTDA